MSQDVIDQQRPRPMQHAEPKWEAIQGDQTTCTDRLTVPGGWLYRVWTEHASAGRLKSSVTLCFVPMVST